MTNSCHRRKKSVRKRSSWWESIPSVHAALFALLPGKSKLGEHRDPFAGSLRYHLGLKTPNSDLCRIYVDGTP